MYAASDRSSSCSSSEDVEDISGQQPITKHHIFTDSITELTPPCVSGSPRVAELPTLAIRSPNSNTPSSVSSKNNLVFVSQPSKKLYCLLCNAVFTEPVIVSCGHTFCKGCAQDSSEGHCPVDGVALTVVVTNLAVAEQVGELIVHCTYGTRVSEDQSDLNYGEIRYEVDTLGCTATVKLHEKKQHEKECIFQPVRCPNNPDCPMLKKKDLEKHLQVCRHIKCPHKKYGCNFHGTAEDLEVHLKVPSNQPPTSPCHYELIHGFLSSHEEQIATLNDAVMRKDQQIAALNAMMNKLSQRVELLEDTLALKFEHLESSQEKIYSDVEAVKRDSLVLQDDLARVSDRVERSGQTGAYDPQQVFKCKGTFVGHQGPVWCLTCYHDYLFSGSSDSTIKVWDTSANYKCIKTLEAHRGIVLSLCVCGNTLFSGSQDCSIIIWDIESFTKIHDITTHDNPICTLASARGMLFSGSLKTVKVFDGSTYEQKRELSGLNHWVRALAVSQNHLFTGSYETIKIWDLDSLECIRDLETGGGSVYCLAITDRHVLCGTYENRIHVWELGTFTEQRNLDGHTGTVYAMCVLPTTSGNKVFSASYDWSIRVWSMENMICTQTLLRHKGSVACLAVSRGRIFSGAIDNTVKVWQ